MVEVCDIGDGDVEGEGFTRIGCADWRFDGNDSWLTSYADSKVCQADDEKG